MEKHKKDKPSANYTEQRAFIPGPYWGTGVSLKELLWLSKSRPLFWKKK